MQLFILTNADGTPTADKSEAAVTSMSDLTTLADVGSLVLGDSEPIELKFTTATGTAPAFAGGATYVPAITLGSLTTDGSGNYAGATGFASITGGWSARMALTSSALISAINILGSGYGNPRGGWLTLQVQVTDPSGYVQTYAMIKVFVEWRVLASSSLDPLTPIEEVLANAANVAALKAALGLTGTSTTLFLTSTADATDATGSTGTFGTQGGISVKKSARVGGVIVAGTSATTLTDAAGKILSAALNTVAVAQGGTGATTSTGTGAVVLNDTPTLITPVIGVASGTSLALNSTEEASTADGLTGSLRTLGGASIKRSLYVGDAIWVGSPSTCKINGISFNYGAGGGSSNMFVGYNAGYVTTAAALANTGIGFNALLALVSGTSNSAFGSQCLDSLTTGSINSGFGDGTLGALDNGFFNSAFGAGALSTLVSGNYNTAFGAAAGGATLGSGNVFLGFFAGRYETGSNSFYLDNQNRSNTAGDKAGALLYGTFDPTPANQTMTINGKVGFNCTPAIAKPTVTGSRGSNAALASLLTALANYGLITDSSS
jgi:hypothetical protein